jgi:hypothetical protein
VALSRDWHEDDVGQLAGMLPLIAADPLGRLQRAADRCRRDPDFGGDLLACVALPA